MTTHYLRLDVPPAGFFIAVPEAVDVAPAILLAIMAGAIPQLDKDLVLDRMAAAHIALLQVPVAGHG